MSTLKVSTLQNLSGTEVYTCKAWVNFNGTGTVAIRASGNVSSITDNGTGDYTVNFTTALTDANYSAVATPQSGSFLVRLVIGMSKTTSAYRLAIGYVTSFTGGFTLIDEPDVSVAVFR